MGQAREITGGHDTVRRGTYGTGQTTGGHDTVRRGRYGTG